MGNQYPIVAGFSCGNDLGGFAGIPVVEHARIKRIQRNAIANILIITQINHCSFQGFQFQVQGVIGVILVHINISPYFQCMGTQSRKISGGIKGVILCSARINYQLLLQ